MQSSSIENLLVITGPCAVGKTWVFERFPSSSYAGIRKALRIQDLSGWELFTPKELVQAAKSDGLAPNMVLHYELTRLISRTDLELTDFDRDPSLRIAAQAKALFVLTLWAPGDVIARRLTGRLSLVKRVAQTFRAEKRHRALLQLYAQTERFGGLYRGWLDFVSTLNPSSHLVANVSRNTPQPLSIPEFRALISNV